MKKLLLVFTILFLLCSNNVHAWDDGVTIPDTAVYVEVEELKQYEDNIVGDGQVSNYKNDLYYLVAGSNNQKEIYIGQKKANTDKSYKTLYSILEVMFQGDIKPVVYFKNNFIDLNTGKIVDGYNYMVDEISFQNKIPNYDLLYGQGYDFIAVYVDKQVVIDKSKDLIVFTDDYVSIEDGNKNDMDSVKDNLDNHSQKNKVNQSEEKEDDGFIVVIKKYALAIIVTIVAIGLLVMFIILGNGLRKKYSKKNKIEYVKSSGGIIQPKINQVANNTEVEMLDENDILVQEVVQEESVDNQVNFEEVSVQKSINSVEDDQFSTQSEILFEQTVDNYGQQGIICEQPVNTNETFNNQFADNNMYNQNISNSNMMEQNVTFDSSMNNQVMYTQEVNNLNYYQQPISNQDYSVNNDSINQDVSNFYNS